MMPDNCAPTNVSYGISSEQEALGNVLMRRVGKAADVPNWLVGVAGFEPATPSSRTRCATRLRYTPWPSGSIAGRGAARNWIRVVFDRLSNRSLFLARPRATDYRGARRRPVLGRSQAVRQRFLVPPSPGSNPGAPAIIFSASNKSPDGAQRDRLLHRPGRQRPPETCSFWDPVAGHCAPDGSTLDRLPDAPGGVRVETCRRVGQSRESDHACCLARCWSHRGSPCPRH